MNIVRGCIGRCYECAERIGYVVLSDGSLRGALVHLDSPGGHRPRLAATPEEAERNIAALFKRNPAAARIHAKSQAYHAAVTEMLEAL